MHPLLDADVQIPLVVDLDGTLLLTDTLHESFTWLLFRHPLAAVGSLRSALQGRAAFKRALAERCSPQFDGLPRRADLVDVLQQEHARGRKLHLITAADQKVADEVAASFGVFDTARGSDGDVNLKGRAKLDYLSRTFPDGFIYAGDHAADLEIFRAARGVILCDVGARTTAALTKAGPPVLAELHRAGSAWRNWASALRVHQWSKNILIFVPLFVGHAFGNVDNLIAAMFGFLLLCLFTSASYLVNDLADLDADRAHPTKRHRPFASGALPIAFGLAGAPLVIFGVLIAAYVLSPSFAATLLVYLCVTTAYSFGLKRVALLDVFVIGVLLTLRIVMGTEVIGLGYSPWLLSFSLTFFLSLALAKRHAEIVRAAHAELGEIAGRGYRADDWPVTLTFGIGVGLVSVVIMLLYLTNDATPSGFYHRPAWLYAVPALIALWLMRLWLLSNRMQLHDDPVIFALKDRISLGLGLAVVIAFFSAL